MTSELIQIGNLRDYAACPNYSKYNWFNNSSNSKSATRSILESCYRDLAVLNKTVNWQTIRGRTYKVVFKESNKTADILYKQSINILTGLRKWYLEYYRDIKYEAICNLELQESLAGKLVSAKIDTLLIKDKEIILIEYTDIKETNELLKDIGIRTKIYLLGKQNILVNQVLAIDTSNNTVKCTKLGIHNPVEWNYKTSQALQVIVGSIKQQIFYPSPTSMCTACPYRAVCSW